MKNNIHTKMTLFTNNNNTGMLFEKTTFKKKGSRKPLLIRIEVAKVVYINARRN